MKGVEASIDERKNHYITIWERAKVVLSSMLAREMRDRAKALIRKCQFHAKERWSSKKREGKQARRAFPEEEEENEQVSR